MPISTLSALTFTTLPSMSTAAATFEHDEVTATVARLVASCIGFDPAAASAPELDQVDATLGRIGSWVAGVRAQVGAARRGLEDSANASSRPADGPAPDPSRRKARPRPSGPGSGSSAEAKRREDAAAGATLSGALARAVADGTVSEDHLIALGRVRNAGEVAGHEPAIVAAALARSADDFASWLRRWDDERDAARGADVDERRRSKRRLGFFLDEDGMPTTRATLTPIDHQIVAGALHDVADELWRDSGDRTSTLSQRLADALVELARRAMGQPSAATRPSASPADPPGGEQAQPTARRGVTRPSVLVVLDEHELRGRADAVGVGRTLDGTPLAMTELRRLLCEADILPVVLGGDGQVLDFGRSRRYATEKQWQALVARDGGCVAAGCTAAVSWCIAHHCTGWEHEGGTDLHNLCLLCPTHHRQLHREGWTARVVGDRVIITRPDGTQVATRNRHGPVTPPPAPDPRAATHTDRSVATPGQPKLFAA